MEKRSSSSGTDDFKQIPGIGPATEERLHESGILTYAQMATMSPADLADLLHDFAGMSAARIENQGWVDQARDLVPSEAPEVNKGGSVPGNGQHYATFSIELLLDENKIVRRTRAVHIQGQEDSTWAGWESDRLVNFIVQRSALRLPAEDATAGVSPPPEPTEPETVRPSPLPPGTRSSLDTSQKYALRAQQENLRRMSLTPPKEDRSATRRKAPSTDETSTSITQIRVIPAGERAPSRVVRHDQPFSARLTLPSSERLRREAPLDYTASLFAKTPGESQAQPVGEAQGTLSPEETDIEVSGRIIAPGTYRLEAHLEVPGVARLSTTLSGGFLHVY